MGKRLAGVAYVKVDGQQFELRGNFTVSPSAIQREGIAGQDGVHGYSENPRVPYISGDITMAVGLSVQDLDRMTEVTVTAELANGSTYVLRDAWTVSAHEINTKDGQVSVRWEGMSCEELV